MREIYKNCERVIVWLGEEDADSACAAFITDVYCKALGRMPAGSNSDLLENMIVAELYASRGDELSSFSKEVASLFQRRWFTRAWVVQEVVLPNTSIVFAGITVLDFDHIAHFASALHVVIGHKSNIGRGLTSLVSMNSARR
jgi:Heterokaryon incompatibility protein (HET)